MYVSTPETAGNPKLYIQVRINCHHKYSVGEGENVTGRDDVRRSMTFPVKAQLTINCTFSATDYTDRVRDQR